MAFLDALLGTANVAFFYAILIWVLVDSLRQSKRNRVVYFKLAPTFFATITVFSSAVISLLNLALAFYQYSTKRIIGYNSLTLPLTWVLATMVSLYSLKTTLRESKRFPLVLILWWIFATIVVTLLVSLKLVKNQESVNLWLLLSEDNLVDTASLPLLLLLCFNVLPNVSAREQSDMEQLLLQKELESFKGEDEEVFMNSGLWCKLTFRWLNPTFKRGRIQNLEIGHIPSVPHSETAENASYMLEESLRKQKPEGGSLTKAITHSVWKSLALNAVLAGIFNILFIQSQSVLLLLFGFLCTCMHHLIIHVLISDC